MGTVEIALSGGWSATMYCPDGTEHVPVVDVAASSGFRDHLKCHQCGEILNPVFDDEMVLLMSIRPVVIEEEPW
jgi:hypothetical protein